MSCALATAPLPGPVPTEAIPPEIQAPGHLLDLLGLTAGIFQPDGTCRYATSAMVEQFGAPSEGEPAWRRLAAAARWRLTDFRAVVGDGGDASDGRESAVLEDGAFPGWRVERVELPPTPDGIRLLVLRLESTRLVRLSPTQLRRFGLTRREGDVAGLLAEGCRNEELARQLGISPHTARRHTERILVKLGVNSRSRVASVLAASRGWREGEVTGRLVGLTK